MRKLLLILTFYTANAQAQSAEDSVRTTIDRLFEGMRKGDSAAIRAAFAPGAVLQTVVTPKTGGTRIMNEPVDSFVASIGRPHKEVYDERIRFDGIRIDGPMASAWTPYSFYVDNKFSHCGVNAFNLARFNGEWKIIYIVDTRRRTDCK
ncbi:MAG: hypothetical protein EOO16_05205 [Chitinophagaceae bacterium]|nr:MAG: hypothetical protein EOO16_05205 [Chitinophagaceae bacterium]